MKKTNKFYVPLPFAMPFFSSNDGDFLMADIIHMLLEVESAGAKRLNITLAYDNSIIFEPYYEENETDAEYELRLKEEKEDIKKTEEYVQYLKLKEKYEGIN